ILVKVSCTMSSASSLEWTIPCAFLTKGSWYLSIKTEKSEGLSCDFFRISSSARSAKFVFKSKYILINLKYHNFSLPAILTPTPKCVGVEVDKIIIYCFGVCLKKSEPILRRTPTNEDAPPPPRGHQRKMFLAFRICARPISSKKERTFFFGVLPSKYSGSWRGDNFIRSGMAEFPPHPPSAMPSLGRTEFLAAALILKICFVYYPTMNALHYSYESPDRTEQIYH